MKLSCMLMSLSAALLMSTAGCDNEPPLPTLPSDPASLPAPPAPVEKEATPAIKPPHGGRLLAMPDNRGYVEWVVDAGRFYLVDSAAAPARGAESIVLTVTTATGPRELPLAPCDEAGFEGACWTNPAPELRNQDTAGVVRFSLEGQPVRVVLGTQPAPVNADLPGLRPVEALEKP